MVKPAALKAEMRILSKSLTFSGAAGKSAFQLPDLHPGFHKDREGIFCMESVYVFSQSKIHIVYVLSQKGLRTVHVFHEMSLQKGGKLGPLLINSIIIGKEIFPFHLSDLFLLHFLLCLFFFFIFVSFLIPSYVRFIS